MKKTGIKTIVAIAALLLGGAAPLYAQMPIGGPGGPGPVISAPGSPAGLGQPQAPGQTPPPPPGPTFGNGPDPAPGSGIYNPGPPAPQPPMAGPGPSPLAPLVVNAPLSSPNWENSGVTTVVACGYDAQGVWRTIPLRVSYNYNGSFYDVTVLSAWNPWTDTWNYGIDMPAFNTSYFLNGTTFNFYTNLSTGTFYFNL